MPCDECADAQRRVLLTGVALGAAAVLIAWAAVTWLPDLLGAS